MMRPPVVILAGGRGSRMGGADKALLPFGAGTLLDAVLARVRTQGRACAISANGDPRRFARFGLPVLPDPQPGQPGPLAGVLAGMEWAGATLASAAEIVTVPVDSPSLPADLVARLQAGRGTAPIAIAASADRTHPVVALWPVDLAPALRTALRRGERRVRAFAAQHGFSVVAFPDEFFVNLNTPGDLACAARVSGS